MADDGATALSRLLAEARLIVGRRGSAVALVLWRLRRGRPGDAAARAAMARILMRRPAPDAGPGRRTT